MGEPKEFLTSTSNTHRPHPSVLEYGYHASPDPTINGYSGFLRWMQEDTWTLIQAVLLCLSIDPAKIPSGYIENLKLLRTYPGVQERVNDFADLYWIALKSKEKGKIEDSMSPDHWIDWFISMGNGINSQFFKAYKATFPDTTWEPKRNLYGVLVDFQRVTPPSCVSCTKKDVEISKSKEEIETLKKGENAVNRNKMLQVIAGLIQANYEKGEKGINISEVIDDLQTVGLKVTDKTLKKYLEEGIELKKD